MSEILPVNGREIELHHNGIEIDLNQPPLVPKEIARLRGINGDILATITLPEGEDPDTPAKQFAVIDYGPEASDDNPVPVFFLNGQPLKHFDSARTRYGLFALNHTPTQHLSSYAPIGEGQDGAAYLGTDETDTNYKLGLSEKHPSNTNTSTFHVIVATYQGKLVIFDQSERGTQVLKNPDAVQTIDDHNVEETHTLPARVYAVKPERPGNAWSENEDGMRRSVNALHKIMSTNRQVYDMLQAHNTDQSFTYEGTIKNIRTNEILRQAMAIMLQSKAQKLYEQGSVIPRPDMQDLAKPVDGTSHVTGISTADYAVLLALKKLDGTFDSQALERSRAQTHDDSWRFGSAAVADRTSNAILKALTEK